MGTGGTIAGSSAVQGANVGYTAGQIGVEQLLAAVPGLQVQYREFPGLGHGPMLSASFKATLAALYGIADHGAVQGAH